MSEFFATTRRDLERALSAAEADLRSAERDYAREETDANKWAVKDAQKAVWAAEQELRGYRDPEPAEPAAKRQAAAGDAGRAFGGPSGYDALAAARATPVRAGELGLATAAVAAIGAFACYMIGGALVERLGPTALAVWRAAWPTTWLWAGLALWLATRAPSRAVRVGRTLAAVGLAQSAVVATLPALRGGAAAAVGALDRLTTQPATWLALAALVAGWQWARGRRAASAPAA